MPEDLHPNCAHMQSARICHVGMCRFSHALDPYKGYKSKFVFLHLTVGAKYGNLAPPGVSFFSVYYTRQQN
jgi:hypothetical protein